VPDTLALGDAALRPLRGGETVRWRTSSPAAL
jgi:hypothetical protein